MTGLRRVDYINDIHVFRTTIWAFLSATVTIHNLVLRCQCLEINRRCWRLHTILFESYSISELLYNFLSSLVLEASHYSWLASIFLYCIVLLRLFFAYCLIVRKWIVSLVPACRCLERFDFDMFPKINFNLFLTRL